LRTNSNIGRITEAVLMETSMADTPITDTYFSTIEEADALAAKKPNSSAWTGANPSQKTAALQEAARRIDATPLRGERYEEKYIKNGSQDDINNDGLAQTLEFPRIIDGVVCDWDHGTGKPIIPDQVKLACLEEAIFILGNGSDFRQTLQAMGVQSFNIGGKLSETFRQGAGSEGLQSYRARQYLRRYTGVECR